VNIINLSEHAMDRRSRRIVRTTVLGAASAAASRVRELLTAAEHRPLVIGAPEVVVDVVVVDAVGFGAHAAAIPADGLQLALAQPLQALGRLRRQVRLHRRAGETMLVKRSMIHACSTCSLICKQ
jgi:hypothetical protein